MYIYIYIHISIYIYIYIYIYTYIYTTKNLLPIIKDILKTLPSSGINNYIKIRKGSVLEKQQ